MALFRVEGDQGVRTEARQSHRMAMPQRVQAEQPARCRGAAEGVQEVGVQAEAVLHRKQPAARFHDAHPHVIAEHDCVHEFGAGRALSFGGGHSGVDDARARVSANHVGTVDLFAVAGGAVGQGGIGR
jgi:hypothetical protein